MGIHETSGMPACLPSMPKWIGLPKSRPQSGSPQIRIRKPHVLLPSCLDMLVYVQLPIKFPWGTVVQAKDDISPKQLRFSDVEVRWGKH